MRRLGLAACIALVLQLVQPSSMVYGAVRKPPPSAPSNYQLAVQADNPNGYWRLGEASGTTAANIGVSTGLDGTYSATGVTLGRPGPLVNDPATAVGLDGASGKVELNQLGALMPPNVTVEAWVKPATIQKTVIFQSPQQTNNKGYLLHLWDNGRFRFYIDTGLGNWVWAESATTYVTGQWYYVVGSFDGTAVRIYVNGTLEASTANTLPIKYDGINDNARIGKYFTYWLNGDLEEVAVYPAALTQARVSAHWVAGAGNPPGAPTITSVTPGAYQATVVWTAPDPGGSPIQFYTVNPSVNGVAAPAVRVDGGSTSANVPELAAGITYSFTVTATNRTSPGPSSPPVAATLADPNNTAFGNYVFVKESIPQWPPTTFGGFITRDSLPALSTWTLEARIWNAAYSTVGQGSDCAWGILGGSADNPSIGPPLAGIHVPNGSGPTWYWPGGGPGGPGVDLTAATPVHVAMEYDGTNVMIFINGAPSFTTPSAAGGLAAAPAGFYNHECVFNLAFQEMRVSNVSRYPATGFTPNPTPFPNDVSTTLLWHLNEHPFGKIAEQRMVQVPSTNTVRIPGRFKDYSNNGHSGDVQFAWDPNFFSYDKTLTFYSLTAGPTPDEQIAGGLDDCPCHAQSGQPVDSFSGEFWHRFDDLNVPGRGIPLQFTRTYSTMRASVLDRLGYGWTDNYNAKLECPDPGCLPAGQPVTVREENGSAVTFTWNGTAYVAASRILASLALTGSTFTLSRKNRSKLTFDGTTKKLTSQIDRNGYVTQLAYDGQGRLSTVTDPASRQITFGYQGTSTLVSSVTDPASRVVNFHYNASNEMDYSLDVATQQSDHGYDASHRMTSWKDAKCRATTGCNGLTNTYFADGRVNTQTLMVQVSPAVNRTTTYAYATSAGTQVTTITDPKGYQTVHEYINGVLVRTTRGLGTTQEATWNYSSDSVTLGVLNGEGAQRRRD